MNVNFNLSLNSASVSELRNALSNLSAHAAAVAEARGAVRTDAYRKFNALDAAWTVDSDTAEYDAAEAAYDKAYELSDRAETIYDSLQDLDALLSKMEDILDGLEYDLAAEGIMEGSPSGGENDLEALWENLEA